MLGQVVGVNTAIVGRSYQGISFAIPSDIARHSYEEIIKNGHVARGYLGVGFQEIDERVADGLGLENRHGALVREVKPDSPADRAGIEVGDVILKWKDRAILDPTDLAMAVAATENRLEGQRRAVAAAAVDDSGSGSRPSARPRSEDVVSVHLSLSVASL